jgi:uncharacterized protein (UPF0276 family)
MLLPERKRRAVKLTTNLSDPLIELLDAHEAPIDGIEVGPWISPREIITHRKAFPDYPFYFHGGSIALRMRLFSDSGAIIERYLKATESTWVSLHIGFFPIQERQLFQKMGWRMPMPFPDRSTRIFIQKTAELSRRVNVPVILENSDPIPLGENY